MLKPGIKLMILSLICCLLSGVVSQAQVQTQSKVTKEGTAEVSGRVTVKDEPARGVIVALQPYGFSGQNPGLRTKTDVKGVFRISRVPAGQYLISALAPGLVTPNDNPFSGYEGKIITVSEGEIIENMDFGLKRGSVITGRITDANGQPLIEEGVRLTKVDEQGKSVPYYSGRNYYMFRTDDRGIYRLYGLSAGRYLVGAGTQQGPGFLTITSSRKYYPQTFHPDATEASKAKVIELGEGEEAAGIDITLGEAKRTYQVFGRVVDAESGQPLPEVEIQYGASRPDGNGLSGWGGMGDRSGPQGEFRLNSVIPGKYAAFTSSRVNSEYYSDLVPFEVANSDVSGVEIRAKRGVSVSGVVVIEGTSDPALLAKLPLLGLYAFVRSSNGPMPSTVTSNINADGTFRFPGLSPGKAQIVLRTYTGEREFSIIRFERGGAPQSNDIEIVAGEQINNLRVIIGHATGVLRGELKVLGATMPEGGSWRITAIRSGSPGSANSGVEADARKQFIIRSLLPGEYELRIAYVSYSNSPVIDQRLMKAISQFKQNVTVASGTETTVAVTLDVTQQGENR